MCVCVCVHQLSHCILDADHCTHEAHNKVHERNQQENLIGFRHFSKSKVTFPLTCQFTALLKSLNFKQDIFSFVANRYSMLTFICTILNPLRSLSYKTVNTNLYHIILFHYSLSLPTQFIL